MTRSEAKRLLCYCLGGITVGWCMRCQNYFLHRFCTCVGLQEEGRYVSEKLTRFPSVYHEPGATKLVIQRLMRTVGSDHD